VKAGRVTGGRKGKGRGERERGGMGREGAGSAPQAKAWPPQNYFPGAGAGCMQCRRGLAMKILSARLSACLCVCLSNVCIVTKRKKDLSRFFIPYERSFKLVC